MSHFDLLKYSLFSFWYSALNPQVLMVELLQYTDQLKSSAQNRLLAYVIRLSRMRHSFEHI